MATPGYVFRDGGPIPDSDLKEREEKEQSRDGLAPIIQQTSTTSSNSPINTPTSSKSAVTSDAPTDSHALAGADHDEKGAVQEEHFGAEVRDLGWVDKPKEEVAPLVGGLKNEELWMLIRRFNKQMYHVKATTSSPPGGLDLYIADEDEFSPDKLRANLERLYMTVIVGLTAFGKHIARLRSWREPRRTAAFAAVYLIAWFFNFLIPLSFTILVILIVFPPARTLLFPPAPIALISGKTGGIQTPKAGVLGSHDSITGAPEKHKGEAVEQEASNFVAGFATIAMSSATGKHEQADPEGTPGQTSIPDPTNMASVSADAQSSAAGGIPTEQHDKTKKPMEEAIWQKMRPIMHIIGDVADGWERFANALSPTPPFPQQTPRWKLASLLVPGIALVMVTTSAMFMKMTTFFFGAGFFGDPLIWRGLEYLNKEFPNWQKLLEIRNTLLKGVPTNAQLSITLLRVGEANRAPIPPPPRSDEPPPSRPASINGDDLTLDASNEEIDTAINADPTETEQQDPASGEKKHHGSRVLGVFKGTTKAGVESKLGIDKARAAVGSAHAKNHLGVLPKPKDQVVSGPVNFKARYKGKKGWVYINTSATVPCVSFSGHQNGGTDEQSDSKLKPVFSIPIDEIQELKKVGGLGWKAKLLVGWATDKTVADGLEIIDKKGNSVHLTAIVLREELFNRLVSMGKQRWESW